MIVYDRPGLGLCVHALYAADVHCKPTDSLASKSSNNRVNNADNAKLHSNSEGQHTPPSRKQSKFKIW